MQAPDTIYDIRGVFDGALLPLGHGYNGNPTILYTSTSKSLLTFRRDEVDAYIAPA